MANLSPSTVMLRWSSTDVYKSSSALSSVLDKVKRVPGVVAGIHKVMQDPAAKAAIISWVRSVGMSGALEAVRGGKVPEELVSRVFHNQREAAFGDAVKRAVLTGLLAAVLAQAGGDFSKLEKAFDDPKVDALFEKTMDLDPTDVFDMSDMGIYSLIDESLKKALEIPAVKEGLRAYTEGATDASEISKQDLESLSHKLHPLLMKELRDGTKRYTFMGPALRGALKFKEGDVKAQLTKWLLTPQNIQVVLDIISGGGGASAPTYARKA